MENKLIFTDEIRKGIWHRKFKSRTVNYNIIIIIIITVNKMSLSSSSGKQTKLPGQPPEALALQKIERKQNNPYKSGTAGYFWHKRSFSVFEFFCHLLI